MKRTALPTASIAFCSRNESARVVLDEIPGVSESRKKALLETFGSVERIRKSSAEEISSVSGIGPDSASKSAQYLARSNVAY